MSFLYIFLAVALTALLAFVSYVQLLYFESLRLLRREALSLEFFPKSSRTDRPRYRSRLPRFLLNQARPAGVDRPALSVRLLASHSAAMAKRGRSLRVLFPGDALHHLLCPSVSLPQNKRLVDDQSAAPHQGSGHARFAPCGPHPVVSVRTRTR